MIRLFEWTLEKELHVECSYFNNILALSQDKARFHSHCDLIRFVALPAYKQIEATFEERACDFDSNWMSAIEVIVDDNFLSVETSYNLFTCNKDSAATTDEELWHLSERLYKLVTFNNAPEDPQRKEILSMQCAF